MFCSVCDQFRYHLSNHTAYHHQSFTILDIKHKLKPSADHISRYLSGLYLTNNSDKKNWVAIDIQGTAVCLQLL